MAYATIEQLREIVGVEHVADDAYLNLCLTVAQREIDFMCRRTFDVPADDATATARKYRPDPSDVLTLRVDDLADLTGVTVTEGTSTLSAGQIQWEPLNSLGDDRRYRPFDTIRLLTGFFLPDGMEATITVTSARWGWLAVPDVVQQATLFAAKDLVHMKGARFGIDGFGDIAVVRIRENPVLRKMLEGFIRHDRTGIA
jgi:hypothetical protein